MPELLFTRLTSDALMVPFTVTSSRKLPAPTGGPIALLSG